MRRRRPSHLEPLGLALGRDAAFRPPQGEDGSPVSFRDWEAAVGTRIAARTRPIRLERGVLLVLAASSTWAQELTLLADAILGQLRARNLPAKALRFRVGHVDAPDRPPQRADVRIAPPAMPLPADLRATLARVENDELRETIARAASRNFGWQELNKKKPRAAPKREAPEEPAPSPSPPPEEPRPPRPRPRSASAPKRPR